MGVLVLAGRLTLAALFTVAGAGKLADLDGSRQAAEGFGLPRRLAAPVGTLLPLAELAVAAALIPVDVAPYAAIAAGILLLGFTAGIANAMAHGREPDCHCFGQIHSTPAGPRTLARNVVLLAVAAFVAAAGLADRGPSATHWIATLPAGAAAGVAGGVAVLAFASFTLWFSLSLLAQNGRIVERLDRLERALVGMAGGQAPGLFADGAAGLSAAGGVPAGLEHHLAIGNGLGSAGLPVGAAAPAFELSDAAGEPVGLADLLGAGRPAMLVFSDSGCGPCNAMMPDVARWQVEHRDRLTVAVIAAGDRDANVAKGREHGIERLLLEADGRPVADSFAASGTPMAVLVSPTGSIDSPAVGGADGIATLLARAVARPPAPAALAIHHVDPGRPPAGPGDPVPTLDLPDLNGEAVSLPDALNVRSLALFWDPDCGFCQRMLPALRDLESAPDRPHILVLAAGDAGRTRAQGLSSPVLLDPHREAQRAFGVDGTPMAVLMDGGRIASPVAIGADAVLALAGGPATVPE